MDSRTGSRPIRAAAAAVLTAALLAPTALAAGTPGPLQARVEALLAEQGLADAHVGLLLYSTARRRYLAAVRHEQPLTAASNTKLVTSYIALRVLGANHRWRTRFSLVEQNDGPGTPPRQGLLIEGGGDPTLGMRALEAIALRLKAEGVRRLDGPVYLDESLFGDEPRRNGLPPESPAYVPLSPFVVEGNAVEFTIVHGRAGPEVLGLLPPEGARVVSHLQEAAEGRSLIRIQQDWSGQGATFTLSGVLARGPRVHTVTTAVGQPGPWFYHWLKTALRRVGVEGEPSLRLGAPEDAAARLLFTWLSPPLREAIVEIEKQSSNLGAELLLRALAQTAKPRGVTAADGLRVARRMLEREFPGMEGHYRLADGSGLSRENTASPLFLVRLLNRALHDPALRTEFLNALPVAGWDGTLRYRNGAAELTGRLRAKTGTLTGVSNLSGYLTLPEDLVVLSFLINDPLRPLEAAQAAQDQVLAGIYEALSPSPQSEMAPAQPAAQAGMPETTERGPSPRVATRAAESALSPPPASPKPRRTMR